MKRILSIALIIACLFSSVSFAADVAEKNLPLATSISGTDRVRILKGSTSENIQWATIQATIKAYTDSLYLTPLLAKGLTAPYIDWNATSGGAMILNKPTITGGNSTTVATDPIWANIGDLVVGTGSDTASILSKGSNGQVLTAGASTLSWQTPATGGSGTITAVSGTSPVVSSGGTTPAISMPAATASASGYMSSTYASKLDGIAAGATNYAHPTGDGNLHVPATSTTNNGKVLTAGASAGSLSWQPVGSGTVTSVTGTTPIVSSGGTTPAISIPAASSGSHGYMTSTYASKLDGITAGAAVSSVSGSSPVVSSGGTTPAISMAAASSGVNGYMTGTYATKLDGIATGATNYTHPTGDGNLHVPATGTSNSGKVLTAGGTAGSLSWQTSSGGSLPTGTVNVATYGALGDDTDQTSSIQAAINAAQNTSTYPNGCVVEFNNGAYKYSALTITQNNIGLKGKGSAGTRLIKTTTTGNGISFYGTNSTTGFIYCNSIEGIYFGQSNGGNASSGYQLSLLYCQSFIMRDIRIGKQYYGGTPYYSYQGMKVDSSIGVHISEVFITDCLNNGLIVNSCVDFYAINCLLWANGNWQLTADTTNALSLVNFETGGGPKGIEIKKTLTSFVVGDNNNRYQYFVNVSSDSTTAGHAWQISDVDTAFFDNCWGNTGATGSYDGFNFTNCIQITMSNTTASNNGRHGVYISGSGQNKLTINGGIFNGNGLSTTGDGIHFNGTSGIDSQIIINGVYDTSNSGYGVYLNDYVLWFIVTSNMLYGNGSGDSTPIRNPTANGTTRIVANNILHWS